MPKKCLLVVLGILCTPLPATAGQWFSLAPRDTPTDATVVEVDLDTVRLRGGSGEAIIRVTHDVLNAHPAGFGYRSFIATAQIDCHRQSVMLLSAAYYAQPKAEGTRVGVDSAGRESGMPARILQSVPAVARASLLKATCQEAPGPGR